MKDTPIKRHLIDETIEEFQITDFSKATIREVKAIAAKAETASGVEFIKMEMGVPGLPPSTVGVKAEIEALQNGIASLYPDINGLPELKSEASKFIKAFIDIDLKPEVAYLSRDPCKVLSHLSLLVVNVMKKKILFCS
jgi:aspartate/methionine/tyrosine aminotransferase